MENNLLQNYLESLIQGVFSHRILLNRYRNRLHATEKTLREGSGQLKRAVMGRPYRSQHNEQHKQAINGTW